MFSPFQATAHSPLNENSQTQLLKAANTELKVGSSNELLNCPGQVLLFFYKSFFLFFFLPQNLPMLHQNLPVLGCNSSAVHE